MTQDEILQRCSSVYKQEIITNIEYKEFLMNFDMEESLESQAKHDIITQFIPEVEKINISNELMATLEKEFELFKIKVQKIMKQYS